MQMILYWLSHSFIAALVLSIMHTGMVAISPFTIYTYLSVFMNVCVSINHSW